VATIWPDFWAAGRDNCILPQTGKLDIGNRVSDVNPVQGLGQGPPPGLPSFLYRVQMTGKSRVRAYPNLHPRVHPGLHPGPVPGIGPGQVEPRMDSRVRCGMKSGVSSYCPWCRVRLAGRNAGSRGERKPERLLSALDCRRRMTSHESTKSTKAGQGLGPSGVSR
jgi:hypothetical protein